MQTAMLCKTIRLEMANTTSSSTATPTLGMCMGMQPQMAQMTLMQMQNVVERRSSNWRETREQVDFGAVGADRRDERQPHPAAESAEPAVAARRGVVTARAVQRGHHRKHLL